MVNSLLATPYNRKMKDQKNSDNKHQLRDTLIGLLIITILLFIICAVSRLVLRSTLEWITFIYKKVSKMDVVVVVALITGACSILAVCISTIIGNIITVVHSNREYLTKQREKPYEDFVEMIYKVQMSTKGGFEYSEQEMLEDISRVSKQITLWGSNNVVNKWVKFRENSTSKDTAIKNLFLLEEIMNDMRKDMGVKKVKQGNLLAFFINDIKKLSPK